MSGNGRWLLGRRCSCSAVLVVSRALASVGVGPASKASGFERA
jgi:hypothetical protein